MHLNSIAVAPGYILVYVAASFLIPCSIGFSRKELAIHAAISLGLRYKYKPFNAPSIAPFWTTELL